MKDLEEVEIEFMSLDLDEYQGTAEEIASMKAKLARKYTETPVVIEDTSLEFHGMGGLPGPYIKDFYTRLGNEGLYRMISPFDDHSATFQCTMAYCESLESDPLLFQAKLEGTIVEPRGTLGFCWTPIFLPKGFTETLGERNYHTSSTMMPRQAAGEKFKTFLRTLLSNSCELIPNPSPHRTLTFITGNKQKKEEFLLFFESFPVISLQICDLDLDEYQGTAEEVATKKAKLAVEKIGGPVVIDDVALYLNALNGLPGPYIKDFLKSIKAEGLHKILAGYEDKSAYIQCTLAYCENKESDPVLFVGKFSGTIIEPVKDMGEGWGTVFKPKDYDISYEEMDNDLRYSINHRARALNEFKKFLEQK